MAHNLFYETCQEYRFHRGFKNVDVISIYLEIRKEEGSGKGRKRKEGGKEARIYTEPGA